MKSDSKNSDGPATEYLPFTIRVVTKRDDLEQALIIRREAYARHTPELAAGMTQLEEVDLAEGSAVLLATSKLDGRPIVTIRIQSNRDARLLVEQSVTLPPWLAGDSASEASRLGVVQGRVGSLVKVCLVKAFYLYCLENEITWMVVTGRHPLYRDYQALLMEDVFPDQEMIPMQHIGGIPHKVLALNVVEARQRWRDAGHPLYQYFGETIHPDIEIMGGSTRKPTVRSIVDNLGESPDSMRA